MHKVYESMVEWADYECGKASEATKGVEQAIREDGKYQSDGRGA